MSEVTAVPIRPIAKGSVSKLWIGLALLFAAALVLVYIGQKPIWTPGRSMLYANGKKPGVITLPSGVQYQVVAEGTGPSPTKEDVALFDYRGTLTDGTVFDQQQSAAMAVDGVVPGFTEGLTHMKKGGSYKLWIPPALAYGEEVPIRTPAATMKDQSTAMP